MVEEETRKSWEGRPGVGSQRKDGSVWCHLKGFKWEIATSPPQKSRGSCVGFEVACLFSTEVSVNQWLTGLSTKEVW